MNNLNNRGDYRSLKPLTHIVTIIIGLQLLFNATYLVFSFGIVLFPDFTIKLNNGANISAFFIGIGFLGMIEWLALLIGYVMFLVWTYRAYKNLYSLRAFSLEYTPGWAVGWWFVPFANLIKPFQILREIWIQSDPEYDEEFGFLSSQAAAPKFIGYWWASWLISNIILWLVNRFGTISDGGISSAFPVIMMAASSFRIIAALLVIQLIRGINSRQEGRFDRIVKANIGSGLPPEPPTFYREA